MKIPAPTWFKFLLLSLVHLLAFTVGTYCAHAQVTGALDTTFTPLISGGSGYVAASAVQPDGKILFVGSFTSVGGSSHVNIARLTVDKIVDSSFNASTDGDILCLAVQQDGKILIGGNFTSVNGSPVDPIKGLNHIARLNADGTTDTTFKDGLGGANDVVNCIALQGDGAIVIGGAFTSVNQSAVSAITGLNYIARLNADGTTDATFNTSGGVGLGGLNDSCNSVVIQSDGKLVIGGRFTTVNGNNKDTIRISRLNANGTQDTSFLSGLGANNRVFCVAPQADGKIVIGGSFTSVAGSAVSTTTGVNRIARLNADGSRDTAFNTTGGVGLGGANNIVNSIEAQTDGKLVLAGNFTSINGSAVNTSTGVNRITRLNADGTRDTFFNASGGVGLGGADNLVNSVGGQPNGQLIIAGAFSRVNGTPLTLAARLNNDAATQVLTAPSPTQVLWTRTGAGAEFSQVFFHQSIDGGITWTPLGNASRVGTTPNWHILGTSLPLNLKLRARGRTLSGLDNGSSGIIEQVVNVAFPDMVVSGNGFEIPDGDATPAPEDLTDFGATTLAGGTVKQTFTISNLGNAALNLTGAPSLVAIGGTNAADFTVTANPTSPVTLGSPTSFQITFDPSAAGLRTATISIDNNDLDENPYNFTIQGTGNPAPTDITLTASSIAENNAANAPVGTLTATDNVGDVNVFTLVTGVGSTDNASFTIVGNTLKITPVADFETKSSYSTRVLTTDASGGTFEKVFTISITNVNDAPVITSNGAGATAAISIAENTTAVTTVTATDADLPAQTLTYTKSGTDAALFNLNSSTGVLTFIAAPDFEGAHGNTYSLTVTVTDNGTPNLTDTQALTIAVTNVNEAPVITSNGAGATAAISIAENTSAVTTVTATDADLPAQTLTYTKSGTDAALFNLNSSTGVLTFIAAPDFEGAHGNTYTLTVTVTDNGSPALNDTQAITVTVTNVNDAPVITSNFGGATATISVAENTTAVTTVIATDADLPAQTLTYAISGTDAALFNISASGVLTFIAAPDFEGTHGNVYTLTVTVTDSGSPTLSDTQALTINVTNVNEGPSISGLGNVITNEDTPISVNFTVNDPDAGAVLTLSVFSSSNTTLLPVTNIVFTTGLGNNRTVTFTPVANEFGLGTVQLNVSDGSLGQGVSFSFSVQSVNDAPNFALLANPNQSVLANSGAASIPAFTTSISPGPANESAQTVSFTVTNDNNALFSAQPAIASNGTLTFTPASAPGTATVTVRAVDNGGTANGGVNTSAAQTFTITIGNPAPTDLTLSASSIVENNAANATVGMLSATDNVGDTNTFTLVTGTGSSDNGSFTIVGNALKLTPSANFEVKNSYSIRVRTTDSANATFEKALTISITDVNETPSISDIANQVTNEDIATSAIAFTVADPDAGTTFTLSATSSNPTLIPVANIAFGGTGTNRTITLTPAANQSGTSTITVQVSDGTLTATDTFVFTVNPVNDPPSFVITSPNVNATTNGLVSGPFSFLAGISFGPANEAPQNVSFTVTNNNNALFNFQPTINSLGELTFTPGSTVGIATVTVIAVDNGGTANGGNDTSASQTFTITFSNPAPTDITLSASSIAENNAANATVGTLAATDNVGDTNTFSLATGTGSTDNASFTITGNALKLTSSADFETKNSYSIRIRTTDNGGGTFEKVFTISITNLNDAPVITSNGAGATASISIAENATAVTTVTATDADLSAQTLTYTKSGTDAALFNLNSSTGVLTFIAAPDFEGTHGNTYTLTVTVTDNGAPVLNDTQAITIAVTNVNEAPSISDIANQVTNEDTATSAIAFTVADPDAGTIFTLSATSSNPTLIPVANIAFGGTGTNRTITLTPAANLSGTSTITVQVSDGTLTATDSFVLTVTPVNDAPSFTLSTAVVTAVANSGAFPPFAIATAISPGPADEVAQVVSFTVANNNNTLFSVPPTIAANGNLSFTPGVMPGTATVTVFAVDNGGTLNGGNNTSTQQSFVINVSNPAPTDIALSANSIPENNATNATVGTLTAADNAGDANTFTLVTGTGSTDNGSFTIVGNALKLSPSANFEIKNSYAIRVRTTDSGLLFFEKAFTIAITNVNEPPTITKIPDLTANPNQTIGTTFDIADPDAGSVLSITFTSSNPTLLPVSNINFIHSGGGHYLVTFTPASNQTGSSTVTAQVSDGTLTASDTFIYSINFVNQAPSFTLATDQLGTAWTPRELVHNGWRSLASSADGTKLVAGNVVGNAGNVYTSADSGVTWTSPAGSPIGVWRALASSADGTRLVGAVTPVGTALNHSLLYVSSDSGVTWTPRGPDGNWVAVTSSADGSKLAAAMQNYGGSIYTSADYGLTWTAVGPGPGYPWTAITSSAGGTKLAATNFTNGIWISSDSGATWTASPYTPSLYWTSIASSADGTKLAATTYNGNVWTSTDSGQNWTPRESSRYWTSIASSSDGNKLAAVGTSGKIYTSTDAGINWTARESARDWRAIASSADGSKLAAVDFASNIYTSASATIAPTIAACSGPASFANVISGVSPGPASEAAQTVVINVTNNNSALFLVPPSITSDGTLTFTPNNISGTAVVTVTAVDNGGTANGGVDTSAPQTFSIVVRPTPPSVISISPATGSTAGGNIVTITGSCLTGATSVSIGGTPATGVNVINATSLTCTVPAHAAGAVSVNVTTPAGTNGTNYFYTYIAPNTPPKFDLPIDEEIGNVWTPRGPVGNWKAVATSFDNSIIAAAASNGPIYVSNDSGLTWAPTGPVGDWVSLTASADGTYLAAVEFNGRIHTSIDSGLHWTAREYTRRWCALAASANGLKLAAVVRGGYIYTSNNAGITWTERAATRNWIAIDSSLNGERLAAVDYLGKIYTSQDSGANWTARTEDGKWNSIVITSDGLGIGATDEDGKFFTSLNGGANWQEQPPLARNAVVEGCHLTERPGCRRAVFIDPVGPMEISEDLGLTRRVVDTHHTWSSLAIGAKLIAAENGGRIYISNPGIANPSINAGSGPQTTPYFVRNISLGTASEAAQAVNFIVSNNNNALFITQPTISPDGTLNFTPGNTAGTAVVTVIAIDNGGTEYDGSNTSAPLTFNIIISPQVVTGYAEWRALHFGSATVGTGSQDDPDADGVPNLLEYAYGLNPNSSISRQIPPIQIANGKLSVTFTEPSNISGITYGAEWSPDLQSWTAIPDAGTGTNHDFSVPISGPKKYMRLRVSEP